MQSLKQLSEAKTIRDFFRLLSWETVSLFALLPALLFAVTPALQFFNNLSCGWWYNMTTDPINNTCSVLGGLVLLLCIGKMIAEPVSFRWLCKEYRPMFFFLIFVLLMLVSTAVNGVTDFVLHGSPLHESLFTFLQYIMIYYFCGSMICVPKMKRVFICLFLSVSLLIAVLALLDYYSIIVIEEFRDARFMPMSAVFINPNYYGYYLVLAILLSSCTAFMEENKFFRICSLLIFIINTATLIINCTFGGYLACLFGLVFQLIMLYSIHRRISRGALGMLLLYLAITLVMSFWYNNVFTDFVRLFFDLQMILNNDEQAGHAGTGRLRIWIETVGYIMQKPLLGWGVEGTWEFESSPPHNEYLHRAVFFGIPASISYICGAFSVYLHGLRHKNRLDCYTLAALTASFGYLVSSFFGNSRYYIVPLASLILGMAFKAPESEKK